MAIIGVAGIIVPGPSGRGRLTGRRFANHDGHQAALAARRAARIDTGLGRDGKEMKDVGNCGRIEAAQGVDRRRSHLAEQRAAQID
jgi:hypothetical protein